MQELPSVLEEAFWSQQYLCTWWRRWFMNPKIWSKQACEFFLQIIQLKIWEQVRGQLSRTIFSQSQIPLPELLLCTGHSIIPVNPWDEHVKKVWFCRLCIEEGWILCSGFLLILLVESIVHKVPCIFFIFSLFFDFNSMSINVCLPSSISPNLRFWLVLQGRATITCLF